MSCEDFDPDNVICLHCEDAPDEVVEDLELELEPVYRVVLGGEVHELTGEDLAYRAQNLSETVAHYMERHNQDEALIRDLEAEVDELVEEDVDFVHDLALEMDRYREARNAWFQNSMLHQDRVRELEENLQEVRAIISRALELYGD